MVAEFSIFGIFRTQSVLEEASHLKSLIFTVLSVFLMMCGPGLRRFFFLFGLDFLVWFFSFFLNKELNPEEC